MKKIAIKKDFFQFYKWIFAVALACMIVAGTSINILSYIALMLGCLAILFFSTQDFLCIFVFIMPFASLFKAAPESTSFFTYWLLLFVLLQVVNDKTLSAKLISIVIFAGFLFVVQIVNQTLNITLWIKLITNLLFLFYVLKPETVDNYSNIFKAYIGGIILSSLIVLFDIFPNIELYIDNFYVNTDADKTRFKGLYSDPNYYSINVIVSLCLIFFLYYHKNINVLVAILSAGALLLFALLTYSKSAFLMLLLPGILLLYFEFKQKKYVHLLFLMLAAIALLTFIFLGKIEFFSTILSRFNLSNGLDGFTTLRTEIWREYFSFFKQNPFELIFGCGLGAQLVNGKGTHNTYLDILYFLGIFGGVILSWILGVLFKKVKKSIKRNFFNYSVLLCVLTMYCFLGLLFYYDWIFHILMAFIAFNMPMEPDRSIIRDGRKWLNPKSYSCSMIIYI